MRILVVGEALIDLIPAEDDEERLLLQAIPGGSPLNVAVGLARLGVPTGFLGGISTDSLGDRLLEHLRRNGIDDTLVHRTPAPSPLAVAVPGVRGEMDYSFYGHRTADRSISPNESPDQLPNTVAAIHWGSISILREPAATTLACLVGRERARRVISFDPNVRIDHLTHPDLYWTKIEECTALSDIVKASRADIEAISQGQSFESVAERWLGCGASLVVLTDGADGAAAFTASEAARVPAKAVEVSDTVGAGDAFTSGLLSWLDEHELLSKAELPKLGRDELASALRFATAVAARTCERAGADPPLREQVCRDR